MDWDLDLRPVDLDLTISESENLDSDLPLWDLTTSLSRGGQVVSVSASESAVRRFEHWRHHLVDA